MPKKKIPQRWDVSWRRLPAAATVLSLTEPSEWEKACCAAPLSKKLTSAAEVPSPTFTLVQSYTADDFEIYHFDLYRLKSPEEIFELGMEEALYDGVCLIEWPEKMGPYLPRHAIVIDIVPENGGRRVTVTFPEPAERLASLD